MDEYGKILHLGDMPLTKVEGLPDAKRFVKLDGHLAKQIAHLALHKWDLEFVLEALQQINTTENELVKEALWEIAIIRFIKCFVGGSGRIQLDAHAILSKTRGAMAVFRYFKDLRDKHFVHDENSYTQCTPAAALNDGQKDFKIEKILAVEATGVTLDQANFANLELATKQSLEWVIKKFDDLCVKLAAELEKETMEELLKKPNVTLKVPNIAEVGVRKNDAG